MSKGSHEEDGYPYLLIVLILIIIFIHDYLIFNLFSFLNNK